MAGLNKAMLIGRLGKDPEVITFDNGGKKMTVTLATSERYRDRDGNWQEQTEWHNIVAWGNLANDVAEGRRNYVKGDLMFVEGRIKTRQYSDSQGNTRYITEIVADKINLISKSGLNTEQRTDTTSYADIKNVSGENNPETTLPAASEDDLPF
jgi:single-strand DNA-binding protein